MSVLKWIHVNSGDDGLCETFRKFSRELKPGGYLVIEPQPWSSYKPKKLSAKSKQIYKSLKLRPEGFSDLLKQEGFQLVKSGKPEVSIGGFSCRTIFVYRKTQVIPDATIAGEEQEEAEDKTAINSSK